VTRYVIRRNRDALFYLGPSAVGSVWVSSADQAHHYQFQMTAIAAMVFEIDEPIEALDIVPTTEVA
jgi:hypothetical protein